MIGLMIKIRDNLRLYLWMIDNLTVVQNKCLNWSSKVCMSLFHTLYLLPLVHRPKGVLLYCTGIVSRHLSEWTIRATLPVFAPSQEIIPDHQNSPSRDPLGSSNSIGVDNPSMSDYLEFMKDIPRRNVEG